MKIDGITNGLVYYENNWICFIRCFHSRITVKPKDIFNVGRFLIAMNKNLIITIPLFNCTIELSIKENTNRKAVQRNGKSFDTKIR